MFNGLGLEPWPMWWTFLIVGGVHIFRSELVVRWLSCCIQRASSGFAVWLFTLFLWGWNRGALHWGISR